MLPIETNKRNKAKTSHATVIPDDEETVDAEPVVSSWDEMRYSFCSDILYSAVMLGSSHRQPKHLHFTILSAWPCVSITHTITIRLRTFFDGATEEKRLPSFARKIGKAGILIDKTKKLLEARETKSHEIEGDVAGDHAKLLKPKRPGATFCSLTFCRVAAIQDNSVFCSADFQRHRV